MAQNLFATPWQVAIERAKMVRQSITSDGVILDPACGSGIQLAAYCAILGKKGVGIELDEKTAHAANSNLFRVSKHGYGENLMESRIHVADGTKSMKGIRVSLLHLDPARPRNSRTHDISEMRPAINDVLDAWKDNLTLTEKGHQSF